MKMRRKGFLLLFILLGMWLSMITLFIGLPVAGAIDQKEEKAGEEDQPKKRIPTIAVEVKLINVDIVVTDKKGNLVTGLKAENFSVSEDGVKQEITNFSPIEAPITVVLLVDYSRQAFYLGRTYFGNDIWDAVSEFTRMLRKDDWAAVVVYDMKTEILTDFTREKSKVYQALRRLTVPTFSESNVSDAVYFVLDRVDEVEGKVAVVLVSTGLDTFSKITYDTALKKAKSTRAPIYSVGIGQSLRLRYDYAIAPETNIEFLQSDNRLRSFSDLTGGQAFFPRFTSELRGIMSDISTKLRHMYSLGYVSSNKKRDGKFRKIKIDVNAMIDGKPAKLNLQYRKGYFAPKED